jgi:hypothetical protein
MAGFSRRGHVRNNIIGIQLGKTNVLEYVEICRQWRHHLVRMDPKFLR